MTTLDAINQPTFADPGSVRWLNSLEGFVDNGERAAYLELMNEVAGGAVLDLGVGTGRTIPLLTRIAGRYVGIDYLPTMVENAHRRFPDVDVELGDARDLSRFAAGSFKLVVFSYAGIDAIDHAGREQVFREVGRVLMEGGLFWFSTLNKEGREPGRRPWRKNWHPRSTRPLTATWELLRSAKECLESTVNYWRLRGLSRDGEGWSIAPFSAHAFGLLVHYTTLEHQVHDLESQGFERDVRVFDADGGWVRPGVTDLSQIDFFNIVARKARDVVH